MIANSPTVRLESDPIKSLGLSWDSAPDGEAADDCFQLGGQMINKVLRAVLALPLAVALFSCGSDENQSQLLLMEKPVFKLGYPKDDPLELRLVTESQLRVLTRLIEIAGDDGPDKLDLLFRRADLYAEQANYFRQKGDAAKASEA